MIELQRIEKTKNESGSIIKWYFGKDSAVSSYFNDDSLYAEYPFDVTELPDSILSIPFVGVLSTACILFQPQYSVISVNQLDKTFADSINELCLQFSQMYPEAVSSLTINTGEIKRNSNKGQRKSIFFTGG